MKETSIKKTILKVEREQQNRNTSTLNQTNMSENMGVWRVSEKNVWVLVAACTNIREGRSDSLTKWYYKVYYIIVLLHPRTGGVQSFSFFLLPSYPNTNPTTRLVVLLLDIHRQQCPLLYYHTIVCSFRFFKGEIVCRIYNYYYYILFIVKNECNNNNK